MPDNPIDSAFAAAPVTEQRSQSSNPIDSAFGTVSSRPQSERTSPVGSSNPIDAAFGQAAPTPQPQAEEPTSWYGRAWNWANTPITSYFGIPESREGAGGFERGLERVASGFLSPLSLGLTIGTFGLGGFLESSGAAALREGLMSAEEIAQVTKGAKAIQMASKAGLVDPAAAAVGREAAGTLGTYTEALAKAGVNPETYEKGVDILARAGMHPDDLINPAIIARGGAAMLRKMGVPASKAAPVAKGVQTLVDAGFSGQMVASAVQASPKLLDALKDGDYDTARELMVEAGFGAGFGALGLGHAWHDAGQLFPGGKLRQVDSNVALKRFADTHDGARALAQNEAERFADKVRGEMGETNPDRLAAMYIHHEANGDRELIRQQHNLLAVSAGLPDRIPGEEILKPRPLTGRGNSDVIMGADAYRGMLGLGPAVRRVVDVDPRAPKIATAYEAMKHDPANPEVQKAYAAMKADIRAQYDYAMNQLGIKFEPWKTEGQPYKNSADMMTDVRDNQHLSFFQGGDIPADHPLAEVRPETGLTYNDMFRAVHDLFGHAAEGFEFGKFGEENAWNMHRQMFSPEAIPALTTETKGQNSWVNDGPKARDAQGNLLPPEKRPYAENKAGLLPPEFWSRPEEQGTVTMKQLGTAGLTPSFADRITEKLETAAEQARKRIASVASGSTLGAGATLLPSLVRDYSIIGASKLWMGYRRFDRWSDEMIKDHGKQIRPYLKDLYKQAKAIMWTRIDDGGYQHFIKPEEVREFINKGKGIKDWYRDPEWERMVDQHFRGDADMFKAFFAATGQGTDLKANMTLALKAYAQWKTGEPFEGLYFGRKNVEHVAGGQPLAGPKISPYGGQAEQVGPLPPMVVDRRMSKIFFGTEAPNETQRKFITAAIAKIGKEEGLDYDQAQAAFWKTVGDVRGEGKHSSAMPSEILKDAFARAILNKPLLRVMTEAETLPLPSQGFREGPNTARRVADFFAPVESGPGTPSRQQMENFVGTHYSPVKVSGDILEGAVRGLAKGGSESERLQYENKVPGVYVYREGVKPEAVMSGRPFKYQITGNQRIADISGPESELWTNALESARGRWKAAGRNDTEAMRLGINDAEAAVRDAGFQGYENSKQAPGSVFLFGDQRVTPAAEPPRSVSGQTKSKGERWNQMLNEVQEASRQQLQSKMRKRGTAMAGLDVPLALDVLRHWATIGAVKILKGAITLAGFNKEMAKEEGSAELKPYMPSIFAYAKRVVGDAIPARAGRLTSPQDVMNHIRSGQDFAILQAENPGNVRIPDAENAKRTEALLKDLHDRGYQAIPVQGNTKDVAGRTEHAFFVPDIPVSESARLARQHGQAGILTHEGLHWMPEGGPGQDYVHPGDFEKTIVGEKAKQQDYYTAIGAGEPGEVAFSVPFNEAKRYAPQSPRKMFHGTQSEAKDLSHINPDLYGQQSPLGVGLRLHESKTTANVGNKNVLPTIIHPRARILSATAKLPDNVSEALAKEVKKITGTEPKDAKSWNDLTVLIPAGKRTEGLKSLQKAAARFGYDGVRMGPETLVFAPESSGRPLRDTVRTGLSSESELTPEEKATFAKHPALPDNAYSLAARQALKNSKFYDDDGRKALLQKYKLAYEGLSDREHNALKQIGGSLATDFDSAHAHNVVRSSVEHYLTHIWEKPDENEAAARLRHDANSGRFATNVSMARQRAFSNAFEGQLFGHKLKTEDPVAIAAFYHGKVGEVIAARNLLDNIRDANTRAPDNRPVVAMSGTGHTVEGSHSENPATFVNPNTIRSIRMADSVVQSLENKGLLDRYIQDSKIVELRKGSVDKSDPRVVAFKQLQEAAKTGLGQDEWVSRVGKQGVLKTVADFADQNLNALPPDLQKLIARDPSKSVQKYAREYLNELPPEARAQITHQSLMAELRQYMKRKIDMGRLAELRRADNDSKSLYAWNPTDYITPDHPAFRDWNFATMDSAGNPVLVKGDMRIHPEAYDYLMRRLGLDKSSVRENPAGAFLLKGGSGAKHLLLSFSPFHMAQEALRAVMVGINPLGIEKPDLAHDPVLRYGVEKGLTGLTKDARAAESYMEGTSSHNALIFKIPGLGQLQDWFTTFLFDKYVPSLKTRAYRSLFERYRTKNPTWSLENVAEQAVAHTNELFGGINWHRMGRSASSQDVFRLAALAPDWLESEVRSVKRIFGQEGGIARQDMLKMALGMWGIARIANVLTTGKMHNEAPFGVTYTDENGREKVYSIRTLPTDMLHMASDPMGFMRGRMSPFVRMGTELYTGRDQFGRKLTPGEQAVDVFRNSLPIPAQAVGKVISGQSPELGSGDQLVKAAGGTATVYKTEAQKLAAQIASDHAEKGPLDPTEMGRHRAKIELEDQLRAGRIKPTDVATLFSNGSLSRDEAKDILKNFKETQAMTPDDAQLFVRAEKLPMKDFLKVYDTATMQERAALITLLTKKTKAYFQKTARDMTPNQRSADPVYQRLRRMYPMIGLE